MRNFTVIAAMFAVLAVTSTAEAQLSINLLSTSDVSFASEAAGANCTYGGLKVTRTPTVGSPTTAYFCYPASIQGAQGPQGVAGTAGAAGASVTRATIAAGGVCGVKAGVAYTLSGVTTNVCSGLDGAASTVPGPQGAQGVAGATGPAGPAGPAGASGGVVVDKDNARAPTVITFNGRFYAWDATRQAYWLMDPSSGYTFDDARPVFWLTNTCTGQRYVDGLTAVIGVGYRDSTSGEAQFFTARAVLNQSALCYQRPLSGGQCSFVPCPARLLEAETFTTWFAGPTPGAPFGLMN